ncbi:Intradiol ring-cleavage dioxygenase, partial [Epithele typhae]|uniref:Intradiol ring-cleavage dioxygenase n=1 Tax=Epithele typhae TaxID=378194 RepID=UPI002008860A
VDTYVDVQIIDVDTCAPVPNVHFAFWHANATGVCSGISASGHGNSASEFKNPNATFLHGIQATDEDGVAQWLSVSPAHYTSCATHVHISSRARERHLVQGRNFSTYVSTYVLHIGQLYF